MIKISVVEDQEKWIDLIRNYLARYQEENKVSFAVSYFKNGSDFISQYKGDASLIFRDVARPERNGIEASKKLREMDKEVCLVFLTERVQYAVDGYEVNAYDFLIKPMDYELFRIKRNKFLSHIGNKEEKSIVINSSNEVHKVKISDIRYVESNKHYLYFHLENSTYRRRQSMDSIKDRFKGQGFSEINRSLLVNLRFVDNFNNSEVFIKTEVLPLSQVYKASFLNELTQYFGEKL